MNRRRRLAALAALWGAVGVGAVIWGVSTVPSDIEERTASALEGTGIEFEVDGRDVTLEGPIDDEVADLVKDIDGVRSVEWAADAATSGATTTAPATTSAPGTTAPGTTAPPSTDPPPTAPPIQEGTTFRAALSQGRLTLSGAVPSDEVAAGIAGAADLIYAPLITNELVVDATAPAGEWIAGLPRAVSVLPVAGTAEFEIRGGTIVIAGVTGSEEKKATLEGALRQALGDGFTYDNQVAVTGLLPPTFLATASGDGTVVLQGAMPDQAAIDLIAGAAVEAFGPDNTVNELQVDEGLEATFSVFRIPFIFAPLSQVPQWEIDIQNDVISGGLRGGASFAYNSAELTPQLQQLATIAAGILARNPTLGATIDGHTDSRGRAAYNQDLSERRANAARDFIIALGVAPERLVAQGFGETTPIASNGTADGRAQNRRIEFRLGPIQGGSG